MAETNCATMAEINTVFFLFSSFCLVIPHWDIPLYYHGWDKHAIFLILLLSPCHCPLGHRLTANSQQALLSVAGPSHVLPMPFISDSNCLLHVNKWHWQTIRPYVVLHFRTRENSLNVRVNDSSQIERTNLTHHKLKELITHILNLTNYQCCLYN